MKIAVAGGHSKAAPGAHGHLDEYTEDRAVASALLAELQRRGVEVVSCTNEKTTQGSELAEEVRLANASGADLFVAIHFNAASPTDGTRGVETWFHSGSSASTHAVAVTNKLAAALGLPNRGAKSTTKLYVLKHTKMPAILVEVCFVDALGDANAYRKLGAQGVARAIADGILGTNTQTAPAAKPAEQPATKPAAKKSNDEVANEIVKGTGGWGNGDERRKKLTAAGYDYATIQGLVNAKLGVKTSSAPKPSPSYPTGTYQVQVSSCLSVRTGAGTGYAKKSRNQVTADAQKHWAGNGLANGTRVTVSEIKTIGNEVWGKIPSGWICIKQGGSTYAKRV